MPSRVGMCFLDRPEPRRQVELAKRCESLGYESMWVCETRTARDAISVLGAMAYATDRIKLAPGVVNSWTRPASLMALTFASLDELATDRMIVGVGAYWDPLAWKQGITRTKPIKQMREYVTVVRKLLAMETVDFEGELVQVHDLKLEMGEGVERRPRKVPIYIGATGLQMLELTGEIGDGVLLNAYTSLAHQAESLERLAVGAKRAGRSVNDLDIPQLVVVAMDDKEPERARRVAHYMATMYLGQQPHIGKASGVSDEAVAKITEAMGSWPPKAGGIESAMSLVPSSLVESLTVSGSAEECRRKAQDWVTRPNIYPVILPLTDNYEEIADAFAPR